MMPMKNRSYDAYLLLETTYRRPKNWEKDLPRTPNKPLNSISRWHSKQLPDTGSTCFIPECGPSNSIRQLQLASRLIFDAQLLGQLQFYAFSPLIILLFILCHDFTDLRFASLRHHHVLWRTVFRSTSSRPAAKNQCRFPRSDYPPRVRRVRRQHRLQPQAPQRRSADHGDHRRGRSAVP